MKNKMFLVAALFFFSLKKITCSDFFKLDFFPHFFISKSLEQYFSIKRFPLI